MKIVALSDIHGDLEALRQVSRHLVVADVVLLVGDLTQFGGEQVAARVVDTVRAGTQRVLAVAGNCDHPEVERYLVREGISLHRRHAVVQGVAFVGIGGGLPFGGTPNEFSEEDLRGFLKEASHGLTAGMPLILVSHQPPCQTAADRTWSGAHVGSRSVRAFIEKVQPLICFTGHIHEGKGIDAIGQTKVINPGPLGEGGYAWAKVSDRVEVLDIIEAG